MLVIDGSYGEGGGQILRTSLALATVSGQPICIKKIRANRKNPGLAAQHLTAVRAAAMISEAVVSGDQLDSTELTFEPQCAPIAGDYQFDVAQARQGGSAGAATLVIQTILLPLALAADSSTIFVRGGTHVNWSPSFHYLTHIFLPMTGQLGFQASAELLDWGWYPAGEGEIKVTVSGRGQSGEVPSNDSQWIERRSLESVTGLAVASSLPSHIAQRMWQRATNRLQAEELSTAITPKRVRSTSPGAGIFLTAEYQTSRAGFAAIGKKGKPSEMVADEAVEAFLEFHRSKAVLDTHLADQLVLPLIMANYTGPVSVQSISQHTLTNIWVVEQFLGPSVNVDRNNCIIEFLERS